jgi:hypothetical protein
MKDKLNEQCCDKKKCLKRFEFATNETAADI